MPIVPRIGRKSLRLRTTIIVIYTVLILGSITTVYPFLIMLATSFASHTDFEEYKLIPKFFFDDKALAVKYLEEKYKRDQFAIFKLRYEIEEPYKEVITQEGVEVFGRDVARAFQGYLEARDPQAEKAIETKVDAIADELKESIAADIDTYAARIRAVISAETVTLSETTRQPLLENLKSPADDLRSAVTGRIAAAAGKLEPLMIEAALSPEAQTALKKEVAASVARLKDASLAQMGAFSAKLDELVSDETDALIEASREPGVEGAEPPTEHPPRTLAETQNIILAGAQSLAEEQKAAIFGRSVPRRFGRFVEMKGILRDFDAGSDAFKARVADWTDFAAELPMKYKDTFFDAYVIPFGERQVAFQNFLKTKYPELEDLQPAIEQLAESYIIVVPPFEAYDRHSWYPATDNKSNEWIECRETLPGHMMNVITVLPIYQKFLYDKYGAVEDLNNAWGADCQYLWQARFPATRPEGASGDDWEIFLRKKIPMRYVKLDVERCRESYLEYLKNTYRTAEKFNGVVKPAQKYSTLEEIPLEKYMPEESLALFNWQEYYETTAPLEGIIIDTADVRWVAFLQNKYASIDKANAAYGTSFASFAEILPPWREADYADLTTRKSTIFWDYVTRNYIYVFKRVFLQGRPLINTFVLVTLTVLSQITINPMAAYALSRYKLSYASKVLIFMLATMAFPAEVTMIPNFLMIKDLHLLNTFGALVLPRLANGYYVFLLKGFFDSLPQELYEAASIDGASEFRMFHTITLPLSMPVLAVIALYAFGTSYGSFLWAFTTCQDKKMWTLMVFLHQFQQQSVSVPYVTMAALVLAAIPTIVVFLSAQKVLMRGIVVPTMK